MTSFYTRRGDDGTTGLLGEGRVDKFHPQIEAVGDLDETSAALGLGRALCTQERTRQILLRVQRDLYGLMAEVAATPENASRFRSINAEKVAWLEEQTEELSGRVKVPAEFIVPGDTPAGAALSLGRAVTRRAERRVATLLHEKKIENGELLRYLNRLSSLLFVLELYENTAEGQDKPTLAKGASE
jgi:cob(I)alamin adenosyltransferase